MAEILGTVASAIQVATICVKLVNFTRKFGDSTGTLRKHQYDLQQLHGIAIAISQNPLLDTYEVAAQTSSILQTIEQSKIEEFLQKSPIYRAWLLFFNDQALKDLFAQLEKYIALLALIINNIQSTVLFSIYTDLSIMAGNTRTGNISVRSVGSISQDNQFSCPKAEEAYAPGSLIPYRGRQRGVNDPPPPEPPRVLESRDPAAALSKVTPPHLGILNKDQRENLREEISLSSDAAISWGNVADSGRTQVNGLAIEGDAECLQNSEPLPPGPELYINNINKGDGDQM